MYLCELLEECGYACGIFFYAFYEELIEESRTPDTMELNDLDVYSKKITIVIESPQSMNSQSIDSPQSVDSQSFLDWDLVDEI